MKRVALALVVVLGAAGAAQAARPPLKASRPPSQGCQWKEFESADLGVRLLVEDCAKPASRYVFTAKGNVLEKHRPADDRTFGGPFVLAVYSKPANQSIEDAIRQEFVDKDAKLDAKAKKGCQVKPLPKSSLPKGKQALTIVPVGDYEKVIMADLKNGPRDFGCGEHGRQQDETYFEYHPGESKTRFLFVEFGWDPHPQFDENTIEILP